MKFISHHITEILYANTYAKESKWWNKSDKKELKIPNQPFLTLTRLTLTHLTHF